MVWAVDDHRESYRWQGQRHRKCDDRFAADWQGCIGNSISNVPLYVAFAILLLTLAGCGDSGSSGAVAPGRSCEVVAGDAAVLKSGRMVPFFPAASDAHGREGLVRIINRSDSAGEVFVEAFDDDGASYGPLSLSLGANETAHFDADDLENGDAASVLTGCTGGGEGDWRLKFASALDIEVLSYVRTSDGLLASMHETAPWADGGFRIATFEPGADGDQESVLRLVNVGDAGATVTIDGVDDAGKQGAGTATVEIPAGAARTYSAADLESGNAARLTGSLGDGEGRWQLAVRSEQAISAVSLLSGSAGRLANLSMVPPNETHGIHHVPWFPSASDSMGRQGLVRVINHSGVAGQALIQAFDDGGRKYEALALSVGARETKHFDSNDLEMGNRGKGLIGSTGAGEGDWRLVLTSDLDLDVLAYVATSDGFLTAMHDTVSREGDAYRVAMFNPAAEVDQESRLRLVNAGEATARVTITGIDDRGNKASGTVSVAVSAGASRTLTAQELEAGSEALEGALGAGEGRWRLALESDRPITVLNLLSGSNGRLANLSSRPTDALAFTSNFHRGEQGFVGDFADYPPAHKEIYFLTADYRPLPPPLAPHSALYATGSNRSDDLFMYFKGQVGGLVPGASYAVSASVEIATDVPSGCVGIGGAPGESVYVKVGATAVEPTSALDDLGHLRMKIDKGNQSRGGENAVVLGNITNSRTCEQWSPQWERKSFPGQSIPAPVTAAEDGRIWLLFGTDSGYEGTTWIYFTRATVAFTPI